MDAAVEKVEAQLKLWGTKIDRLADKAQRVGARTRFEDLLYIDELKALHVIAQAKLDGFKAAGAAQRAVLKAGMKTAWEELDAAFKNPRR
jgi:hypothetical protein